MPERTRYQAAIMQEHRLLLLYVIEHQHDARAFWVIPGGRAEPGESEEACVRREVREETHLEVAVDRLLLDEPGVGDGIYTRLKTYLCHPLGGRATPGCEPEEDAAGSEIHAVGWFDLRDPATWDPDARADPITYPLLQRIRAALGYAADDSEEGSTEG